MLTDSEIEKLLADIAHNQCGPELKLSEKKIEDDLACRLAATLAHNSSIKVLDLSQNAITHKGIQAISEALKVNTTLTDLRLDNNTLGFKGAFSLAEAIKVNKTLTALSVNSTQCTIAGAILIANALRENMGIQKFQMARNGLDLDTIESIREIVKDNRQLISVLLGELPQLPHAFIQYNLGEVGSPLVFGTDLRLSLRNPHIKVLEFLINNLFPDTPLQAPTYIIAQTMCIEQNLYNLKLEQHTFDFSDFDAHVKHSEEIQKTAAAKAEAALNAKKDKKEDTKCTEDTNPEAFDIERYHLIANHLAYLEKLETPYYPASLIRDLRHNLQIARLSWGSISSTNTTSLETKDKTTTVNATVDANTRIACIQQLEELIRSCKRNSNNMIEQGLAALANLYFQEGMDCLSASNVSGADSNPSGADSNASGAEGFFALGFVCGAHGTCSVTTQGLLMQCIEYYSSFSLESINNSANTKDYRIMLQKLAESNFPKFKDLHLLYFQTCNHLKLKPSDSITSLFKELSTIYENKQSTQPKTTAEKADTKTNPVLSLDEDENPNREKRKSSKP